MNANRWKAVVFDLDDTLYAESQFVLSGMRAAAAWAQRALGAPAERSYAELQGLFDAGARGDTFNRWLEDRGLASEERVAEMVRVYRQHTPQIVPFPQVPALLHRLGQEYRLGLLSDGYLEVQRRKLAALGLKPYFEAVVFSDQWGRPAWKPSPKPFQSVLRLLAVEADRTVYVADNPLKDFRGARQLGIRTIRLRHPGGLHYRRRPPSVHDAPHMTIRGHDELEAALERLAHQRDCPAVRWPRWEAEHEAA